MAKLVIDIMKLHIEEEKSPKNQGANPKEPKGKYKSSGYGDLKESKLRKVIREMIDEEIDEAVYLDPQPNPLRDLTKMLVSAGINAELRGLNYDFIRVDDDKYEISLQNGMHRVRDLSKAGSPIVGEYSTPQEVVNYFTKSSNSSFPKVRTDFDVYRSSSPNIGIPT